MSTTPEARRVRVYISGPMTGQPDLNRGLFAETAEWLAAAGYDPVNPHDVDPTHPWPCPDGDPLPAQDNASGSHRHPYGCWLRAAVTAQLTCDEVLMLPGWEWSNGARVEHDLAEKLGQPIRALEIQNGRKYRLPYPPATTLTGAAR